MNVASVVVPHVEGVYSYRIPTELSGRIQPGMRVLVPFGRRRLTGYVVDLAAADERAKRRIDHVLDDQPVISPSLMRFAHWMSEYYLCSLGDVFKAALPAGVTMDERLYWVLRDTNSLGRSVALAGELGQQLVEALRHGPLTPIQVQRRFGLRRSAPELVQLEKAGVIICRPVLRPPQVRPQYDSVVKLSADTQRNYGPDLLARCRSIHEQNLLREIQEAGNNGLMRSDLLKGASSARREAFGRLVASGRLELCVEEVVRWNPQAEQSPKIEVPQSLTEAQQRAVTEVTKSLDERTSTTFLLYGVTGSGKTQVYIECIRRVLEQGRTSLVLLPEIALTPFVWGRFYQAFGDRVAIQHSAQSPSVRYDLWKQIRAGKYPVVIGARSAVFAPLQQIGLVVIDEEQESSYKQEDPDPRYHARDSALMRARMENATAILGSATPSLESMHLALTGRYQLLRLPERVGGGVMPAIRIVRREHIPARVSDEGDSKKKRSRVFEEPPVLTEALVEQIARTLENRKQVLVLQNRRGYSPFLICSNCGKIPSCPDCAVSLTYHRKGLSLRCHYCDHREEVPNGCHRCGSPDFAVQGIGTQRVEEELSLHFPQARVLRMDSDTASRRGIHSQMVAGFSAREYDILVGTQMIAKGLDFPDVELAAFAQADAELFYPDFRAFERGAALITQLAGRSGRRTNQGTVVIQSAVADHPVLSSVLKQDWEEFAVSELKSRVSAGFPPFSRLVLLRALAKDESSAIRALLRLRRIILRVARVEVLGPAPAIVPRIRNRFRVHLLARTRRKDDPAGRELRETIRKALGQYRMEKGEAGVTIEVDVDPQSVA